jgi:lysozyme
MSKITKTGQAGIDLIKTFEGFKAKPYLCPAKVPTIGYGATYYSDGKKVTMNDKAISEPDAVKLLMEMLVTYERSVDSFCIDDINQNQFDALVSFAYNAGVGNLKSSTLLKKVNANFNDPAIRLEFMKWVNGGDGTKNGVDDDGDGLVDEAGERQRLKGLVKRRTAEADLYFKK